MSEEDKQLCEKNITIGELTKTVNILKKDKSPGDDGLIAEFYQKYWDLIKQEFSQVIHEIENSTTLCKSQNRGVISLIYKQGERELIKKWRPITFLNID